MKIVIISNLFPPFVRGGAELVAAASAKALSARGHEVTVISTCPTKLGAKRYEVEEGEWEGLRVLRFFPAELYYTLDDHKHKYSTRLLWHIQDAFNMYSAGVVRKLLKKIKPDCVITHNLKGIGLLIPGVIHELKIPHIHTLHDVQLIEPSGLITPKSNECHPVGMFHPAANMRHPEAEGSSIFVKIKNFFTGLPFVGYRFVTRWLFSSPALVVSPTEWLLELHRADGFFQRSQALVLQNPVREVIKNQEINKSINQRAVPKFVFVGQIENHKGINELIDAWLEAEKNPDFIAELEVIGDGTLLSKISERVGLHERIRFHGRLPNEKVLRLLEGATALVFPSKCLENAPGAVLEALSLGVPVLATDVGGVPEFVRENQSGWLIPPGDTVALSRMLRHVVDHPKEVAMLKAALLGREKMTAEKYAEKLENPLSNLGFNKAK
ncbi:MAG: glycosyltransferase [bacterium]